MGKYLLTSLFFVVAAMIEFAIALLVKRVQLQREDDKLMRNQKIVGPQKLVANEQNAPKWMSSENRMQCTLGRQSAEKNGMDFNISTNTIDIASFVIYLLAFVLFNFAGACVWCMCTCECYFLFFTS